MRLLRLIQSANVSGGGPIEGIIRMTEALARMGHKTTLVSLDEKLDCERLKNFAHFQQAVALGNIGGGFSYSPKLIPWLRENHAEYDAVFVHGLWQFHGYAAWMAVKNSPYFVYPHGMLDPWFKIAQPIKHIKKQIYWSLVEHRVLRDAAGVIFTSNEEAILAQKTFSPFQATSKILRYGTAKPSGDAEIQRQKFFKKYPETANKRMLLYLGRIHPKKGCEEALQAFCEMAESYHDIHFVLAGGCEEIGYQRRLLDFLQKCPHEIQKRVTLTGALEGDLKWGAFRSADAFILPSHQENFGIAVAEALACGVPPLISNRVNIWRDIEGAGAGLVAPDDREGARRLVRGWLEEPTEKWRSRAEKCRQCFEDHFHIERAAEDLIGCLQNALEKKGSS